MQSSTRVIVNTGVQYTRTFISACIALYSSRLILQALGESDYGIYSLIAGVISMLAFIHISLASTTQRYLSFYQGKRDSEMQVRILNNSLVIQLLLALALAATMYLLTPFLFGGFLHIPAGKTGSAVYVYYSMIISLFFAMLSTPYLAALIAHENIVYISIIQIVEAILKLAVALSLRYVSYDQLVYYAVLMSGLSIVEFLAYSGYCWKKYEECRRIHWKKFDKVLFKELFTFSGWTIYSTGCIVVRTQGIAVLFNRFFGTVLNAAYGIAGQLVAQINFMSTSLLNAIRPQIMKAEGDGNRPKVLRLSEIASKFAFLLLAMIVIPAVFEMPVLLDLWLDKVPDYAVVFSQWVLLAALVDQLTIGLGYANQAIGRIRNYSLIVNTTKLCTLPVAYWALKSGLSPVSVLICMLLFEAICSLLRLFLLKQSGGLSIGGFVRRVFIPEILPLAGSIGVCWLCHGCLPWYGFAVSFLLSIAVVSIITYYTGLYSDEKQVIDNLWKRIKTR